MRQGHSAAWDQNWDQAIPAYRSALAQFPDDPTALTSLGYALLQSNQLEPALQAYQRAAGLNPGDPLAPEKCGEIFERLGRTHEAAQTYLAVAEVHLRRRDVTKAIDNWTRVVRLAPNNLAAHSRLALASERIGQTRQAVLEYLEVARIFQRARDLEKALAAVNRALQLDAQSAEAHEALDRLHRGVALPASAGPRLAAGSAGAAAALAPELEPSAPAPTATGSPLEAAQEAALGLLADLVFSQDLDTAQAAGAAPAIALLARGTGRAPDQTKRAQAIKSLSLAISSQMSGEAADAIEAFEAALRAGLDNEVVCFSLGALYAQRGRTADAIKWLQRATEHDTVGIGALFGLGQAEHQAGLTAAAFAHLVKGLHRLDRQLVAPDKQDALDEAYESLAEEFRAAPPDHLAPTVAALIQFLTGPDWRDRVNQARRQLDSAALDVQVGALAELVAMPGASQIVESLRRIETYMAQGCRSTAMEEAFFALSQAPTHLPVHVRMAEILVAEGKTQSAIDKYTAVAQTYRIRGELARATRIVQHVLRLSPLDATIRSWLIEMRVEQGKIPEALEQFMDLADTYYQLTDLDAARTAYADALLLAEQHSVAADWRVRLLHKMGDIDLQRLNWRDAQRVYEQIRDLAPDDHGARATLIDLLYRLGNSRQAVAEVDAYLRYLLMAGNSGQATSLLEAILAAQPNEMPIIARLARLYQDTGRRDEAITLYDQLGELQLQAGQAPQAAETIRAILALGPADVGAYQQLLKEIER